MSYISHDAIQYTIRQTWRGPVIYVRTSLPTEIAGVFEWGRWRKARDRERDAALIQIVKLNKL